MSVAPSRIGRRLHHARFVQPRQPAFWLFVVVVGLTGIVALVEQSLYRDISPAGWALSWILLSLYGIPVFVVIYLLDLYEREPVPLLLAAFVWGAVAATTLSAIGNSGWGLAVARLGGPEFAARWTAALTAPFVEEILKGCGVVLVYLIARDEVDDVMDGFVYGAICGLGFAIVEDVFYFMAVFGGQPGGVLQGFWLRVVASGLYGHVLYTGLVGMAVGIVVSRRGAEPLGRRLAIAAGLCSLAVFAHFLWNSPFLTFFPEEPWSGADMLLVVLATAVKGLPLLVFVAIAVILARRRERRWLREALAGEVGLDGISAGELRLLEHPRRRRAARREMRRRAGARAAALLHRLQREQVNLAMVASRVGDADDPALRQQRAYCRSLRDALEAIPAAAPAAGGAPAAGRLRPWTSRRWWPGSSPGIAAQSPARSARSRTAPTTSRHSRRGSSPAPGVRSRSGSPAPRGWASPRSPRSSSGRAGNATSAPRCSPSTPARRTREARCWGTGYGCRSTRPTRASSSGRWPRAAISAGWRSRPRRRCGSSMRPATSGSWWRRSAWGRRRSTWPRRPTPRSSSSRPAWVTPCRWRRRASSRSPTSSS